MKRNLFITASLLISLCFLLTANTAKASHAAGGELVYKWKSDSTYTLFFKFYRDCTGISQPGSVPLCVFNTCTNISTAYNMLAMTAPPGGVTNGSPVSTGCANQKSTCDSVGSTIPGYREWWYSVDVTLPSRCNYWKFAVWISARNNSMNIGGGNLYLETIFNNQDGNGNSSPDFTVKPVPYVCLNQPYKYNNGGVDPDGDSVAFEVMWPLQGGSCGPSTTQVSVNTSATPPLSLPSNPFQTNNSFTINPITGEMSFTPSLLGAQTVTVRANEYRNGVQIGSVMRDIQVQVINCLGGGVTPTLTSDPATISGGTQSGGVIYGCAKTQLSFCFDIKSTSSAAQLVVTDNSASAMPGSVVTYQNLQTDSIRGCVTWTPNPTDSGNRVFVVTVKDSSCSSTGVAISNSITVPVYIYPVTAALQDTAICLGDSVQLIGLGGNTYSWSVIPGGAPISSLSCTSCKTPIAKPNVTTSYIVSSNSSSVCNRTSDTVTVTVVQQTTTATSNSPVCPGDTVRLFGANVPGVSYIWTGPNGFTSNLKNPKIPNASSIHSGFYQVRITNGACTSQAFQMQIYVGKPAGPAATSNSPVCEGKQLNLNATNVVGGIVVYHWSGPNGFSSTLQNPVRNNMTFADTGIYYAYATVDGCNSFVDSVTVKVNPIPVTPTVTTSSFTFCQGAIAANLTASGTNLKWYTSKTGGIGVSPFSPPTSSPGIAKYYVSQSNSFGCESERDSVTVNVIAKPADPVTNQNIYYCQGYVATQLTATGNNLKWYVVPTGGAPLANAPTPSTATPGNTVYFVSQTNTTTGCESSRIPITITVLPSPTVPSINSPATYCQGGPATPALSTFVGGLNIKWYTTSTGGTGSSAPPIVNTSVPSTDTYYVSQTVSGCEGPRAMLIVIVNALPSAPQTQDTAYCIFETAAPLTANGQNLLWYTGATGGVGSTSAPTPVTTSPGMFRFYVSQTVNGCESPRDSVTVTVHALPGSPVGNDDSICEASFGTILTATGSNLLWYTTPTGGVGTSVSPTPSTAVPGTFYWYVSQTVNGCESERDTVEVEIVAKPAPPVADSAEFCFNGPSDTLTATGQNLLWYYNSIGGIGSPVGIKPPTLTKGIFYYYVSQTLNGCESDRDTAVVNVDTLVNVRIVTSMSSFCQYDSVIVSQKGLIPDTGTFNWNWNGGKVLSGKGSGPYYIQWDGEGVKTIELNAEHDGCKAKDKTTVEVYAQPESYFDLAPEICVLKDVNISIDSVLKDADAYNWVFDSEANIVSTSSDNKKQVVNWAAIGDKVVKLMTVSTKGCQSEVYTDTIIVKDGPKPKIAPIEAYKVCTETEMDIKATVSAGGLYKYHWQPMSNFLSNDRSAVRARLSSSGYISVTATDEFGCFGTDSVYLEVQLCCKAVLPTAFSPNGDGRNDKFGIISNGHYKIYNFRVVNRAGNVVFSTTNQNEYWDGTHNGRPADIGVYFYFIKYNCEDDDGNVDIEEKGDVTLVR